jgi:peptidoglycan hydrolase-like amidase
VEDLRLAAGRAFGWNAWPSDACAGEVDGEGNLRLEGHGLGHNVGLCLAAAKWRALRGDTAEAILKDAF